MKAEKDNKIINILNNSAFADQEALIDFVIGKQGDLEGIFKMYGISSNDH
jgi:hypothetical protein